MDPDFANLIDQLNGLIFMARVTWQSSSGKCADTAHIPVCRLHASDGCPWLAEQSIQRVADVKRRQPMIALFP
jgi:hypothetical protein